MPKIPPRSRTQNFVLILTLGVLNALTPFTIDMYLPSFPQIARDFGVTVTEVALTVSVYFIGFALGQLFYGPLLDRFGRKRPLYFGLGLYVLASAGCMGSRSLEALVFFRFLSALGGCAASVGAMAMVRDFFPPEAASKIFSLLMLVLSVSPLLAPSVGSLVVTVASWPTIFAILGGLGIANLGLVYVLPPAQAPDASYELRVGAIAAKYRAILANGPFTTYALAGAFSFTGLFVYVASSPAIFMDGFGVNARVYGAIFAFLAAGMIGGGQLNLLLTRRFRDHQIFSAALGTQVVLSCLFFFGAWFHVYGLGATIFFLFSILLCAGLTNPNGAALALAPFTRDLGSASALLGFINLGIGSFTSAVAGLIQVKGSLPTALVMCVSSLVSFAILWWRLRLSRSLTPASGPA